MLCIPSDVNYFIPQLNFFIWNYVLIYGLFGIGLFFTFKLKFIQFIYFPEMFRAVRGKSSDPEGISPFQALAISLASRVGTGNLTGVAVALYLGGPGTVFWMWMVALLGMATAYAESTLAQLYKIRGADGRYRGGPAFYISRGLNAPIAATIFSICLIINFGLIFNAVQANSIAEVMQGALGVPKLNTGVFVAALCSLVIFGGLGYIARVVQVVMPAMSLAYLSLAIFIIATNFALVPDLLRDIVSSAFGLREAAGGVAGSMAAAMLNGVKRGFFSNEAGMGSAPNIAAVATPDPHHPTSQGLVQALGVFIDTILICTATAIIILLSGVLEPGSGVNGAQLTQHALTAHLGPTGTYFVAVAIFCFAFASLLGNYTYAENAMNYLGASSRFSVTSLRFFVLGTVVWGACADVETVFSVADITMGLMGALNLTAVFLLADPVIRVTHDYFHQRKLGRAPEFHLSRFPEIQGKVDANIWSPQRV